MKQEIYVISGATGFIGRALVDHLVSEGNRVVGIVRTADQNPVTSQNYRELAIGYGTEGLGILDSLFNDHVVEKVFHCATMFVRSHTTEDIPELIFANEILGCYLLQLAAEAGVSRFVNLSSSWQIEGQLNGKFNSLYAVSKQSFLNYLDFFAHRSTMQIENYYLFETVSASDTRDKVFNLIAQAICDGSEIKLGNPNTLLNYSNVNLVCAELAKERAEPEGSRGTVQHFEILNSIDVTLSDMIEKFERLTGQTLSVQWGQNLAPTLEPFWRRNLAYGVNRITLSTDLDEEIRTRLLTLRATNLRTRPGFESINPPVL